MTDEELQKARELTLIERVALPHTMFEVRRTYKACADTIAALLDERDVLARNAAYWKEEARRYCENADFWRSKFEVAAMKGASNES